MAKYHKPKVVRSAAGAYIVNQKVYDYCEENDFHSMWQCIISTNGIDMINFKKVCNV